MTTFIAWILALVGAIGQGEWRDAMDIAQDAMYMTFTTELDGQCSTDSECEGIE